ncbi:enoyl-CoA hydratase/isomerase family protein [Echinicola sp. 20G]|uniref:enoyl-CoA hydratase/isomerase family protein n=1 Tax=Echinicola sp. 20G TaxID=2781961 RepID=UPI001910909F|nr:enoyl-CoA hydratase-related protein [Echinicola sp. 20G]
MEDQVKLEQKDRLGYIILNRPEKRNALNAAMVKGIQGALDVFEQSNTVKVVIIKAEGKVFCSGADLEDIKKMQTNTYEENLQDSQLLKALFYRLYNFPKLVIAQVQGHALAGGCGLVSVCDFVYAAPQAKLGYTEVKIGFVPAMVLVFLLRKLGEGKAKELLLGGELIEASQAVSVGLVNAVIEPENLDQKVQELANHFVEHNSGSSMALTKEMIGKVQGMPLEDALDYAAQMNARARASEDCKKGIAAFLEKKKIQW